MRIKHEQWVRRSHIKVDFDNVQLSMYPMQGKNDERDPNEDGMDGRRIWHLQCDCCGVHQHFGDGHPDYEGSGWTSTLFYNDGEGGADGPIDMSRYNPDIEHSGDLFEVDLCDKCSKEHKLAEFEHLPRTGCEWCWKRFPKDQLVRMTDPQDIKDGYTGDIDTRVCHECAAKIKRCTKCRKLHWKEDFPANSKSPDGLDYICKDCRAAARQTPEAKARDAHRKRDQRRKDSDGNQ